MEKTAEDRVKLFTAVIKSRAVSEEEVVRRLEAVMGETDHVSALYPFVHTDYYEEEMGPDLFRMFVGLKELKSPEYLVEAKHLMAELEDQWRVDGNRAVNLDPGYLDYTKIVLASFKPGGWKIYVGQGVYADMTLYYGKGEFIRFGWTFPDFREGTYDRELLQLRNLYKKARR